ncbi:MAG TPA: hypothetical protein PKE04_17550 [Clostridia bacterium]|nr:hypothetical protein [Clostridia bacterium]
MKLFTDLKEKLARFKGMEWIVLLVLFGILGSLLLADGGLWPSANQGGSGLEARLAAILSSMDGVGRVQVMIYDEGSEQSDGLFQVSAGGGQARPVGVVVVADGADDIRVRLELVRAVQTLMNLPADAVEVFQMSPAPAP